MIKNLIKKLNPIKICAVFTAVCFVVSTLGSNLYAIATPENTAKKYEDIFNKVSSISAEYGKITSSKDAQSDITVINIQDLHCHPQTQRNISKIIAQIADKYNLKKIYVEGGYGDIDVSWLNSVKDEGIRKQVIEKLLEDGILTGSEYYKLTSNNDKVELKGIDEEQIHKDNVRRLSWIINNQKKYKQITEKVNKEVGMLEKTYVNKRNEKFNKNIEKYSLNQTDNKKFYRQLVKYIRDVNKNPNKYNNITSIRLEDYPNISKFMFMIKNSDKINIKKVKHELQELILLLKTRLPFNVYTQLLKETNNFTDNQKSLELINSLCAKENINLNNNFKEFVKLSNINSNNQTFNPVQLVLEERQLINEIRKALSYNNKEYEITFVSDFSRYFKDYLEYKLTDADWKYFERKYERFRELYAKYAVVDRIKEIENDFIEINEYYKVNDKRNNVFVENLLKNEEISINSYKTARQEEQILKDSKEVIIAITGGFHSSELENLLSVKKVNTITITPFIHENTNQSNKKYIKLVKEQGKINSQAIAYTIISCLGNNYQKQLMLKVITEILGKKNVNQINEVLKDADSFEIEDVTQAVSEEEVNKLKLIINFTIDEIFGDIKTAKDIALPSGETIDNAMIKLVSSLVDMGFYFSKGVVFEIENSDFNGIDLKGVPAEIYSRMLPSLQKALLAVSVDKNEDKTNYETPQLTITFLKKILDKTSFKRSTKIKIVSVIEAPIIMLGLIFPSVNKWFLKRHKVKDILEKVVITSELETLNDDIKNTYFNSFISIKETIRVPLVRTIVAFSISIVKAFKANIQGHIEFNTTAYLVQSYKDFVGFDIKYSEIFKYANLTTRQEKKIIRDILNLKDKFNANGSSKSYSDAEIVSMLQKFETFEIRFFKKNKRPLYINSVINTPSDLQKINELLLDLFKLNILNLETENNMLALKIFKNNTFNELINQSNIEYGKQSLTQKYFIAIAVARYISQVLDGQPVNNQNFNEIVKVATETYIQILEKNENKIVIDKDIKIIAISAQSGKYQQFNNNGIKKLLQKLNIPEEGANRTYLSSDMESALKMKEAFLNMIANLNANDRNVFISFDGHGSELSLALSDYPNVTITIDEFFNALRKARENGFDLNNLTINLSSCESWFFAKVLYSKFDNLYKRLEKRNILQSKSYPTIWTAAGHETKYGYTDEYDSFSKPLFDENKIVNVNAELGTTQVGNEWKAVLSVLGDGQQTNLKVKDILRATLAAKEVNFTLFISDKAIEQTYNKSAQKILELNPYSNFTEKKQQKEKGVKSFINNLTIVPFVNIKNETLNFNRGYFELSIFHKLRNENKFFELLADTAHIWEEIIFRAVPVSIAIISMSFPAISCLSVPVGLMFFAIFQYQFVKAHNISAWIKENNLDWKTSDILLATLFNIFPDKDSKEKFNTDAKKAEVSSQTRSRFLPTLLLSIPYLYSLFFVPSIAVVVLATIIGIFVHKYLNLILKNKLNIFDEASRFAISPDKDFKIDSNYAVSLKNSDETQKLISLLNGRKLSKEEAEFLIDVILSNVEQYGYFIELLQQIWNRFIGNVELLVETLAERIDITNSNQLNLFKKISENLDLKWETVLPTLFKRMDLNNDANVSLMKYFISKNQYNSELSIIVVEKADFNNKNHLSMLNDLRSIKDDVLSAMMNKTDIKNVEHLSLILNSLLKAGYLFSFQKVFSDIIKEINLSDKQALKIFSDFMKKNEHSLSDNNIKLLIQKINFEADEQVELLEFVLKKNAADIDLVFDVLLANNIDLNDTRYSKIFKIIIDKMLSKYSSRKDARKYLSSNIFLLPANSVQGKYAFSSLIDLLHNELIAHQNKYLKIVNGHIAVRVNENGTDPTLESILRFTKDIDVKKDLFDSELKTKFDGFVRNLNFLKEMENRTPKISYTRKRKIADSTVNNLTIEEFCKEKGFSLMKQTPNVFFDSRRYSFTSVLNFISKKLFNFRPHQHNPTYIMTTNTVDAEKLDGVISLFDIYMKLLDENLYTLNKIDDLTDFSSQFDDIVYHTNLMINYLGQISSQNVSFFKRSLKNILAKIERNDTTIEEQKKPIESQSNNIIEDIPTINALVNRIHQQANMSFLMKVMYSLSDYENVGYNTLISKNANLISVYNLSADNINPQVERFLSDLAENPDFSTDVKTPIFVKDNIVLWVAKLGAHSVRVLIDFNEETKSIIVDFHEGAIDDGSTIRIKMLDNILTNIGFEVKESVRDFESRRLPVGIVAKLNKDVGLTTGMDFNNIAKQTVILFNNAASLNNLISNKFQMRHNIDVAKLAIMDIYSRNYALSYIRSNFVRTRLNSRRNLNKILKSLELPLIPRQEQGFWTFLKIGMIRVGFIKTYGQNTIDKYINKPIERAFATGYLKIDKDGILKRDTNYNPLSSAAKKMSEMLNSEPGNYQETDMLNQGALLSQIPQGDLNFTTIGKVGGYVVKTGYIKLNNGRLNENTKGEFLAVTILVDKNGILRYSSSELAGFPQNLKSDTGRISLNVQQLTKILEAEGYKTYPIEPLNDVEISNYRAKLKERIAESKIAVAYGTIISTSKQKRKTVFGLMDNKNTSERNVYINKYASPSNVKEASQHQVSLFAGGSYSSHAAILLREYEKTAMIVNNSQIIDKDKKMRIKFYQSTGNVRQEDGLQVQDIEEKDIVLQENDIVLVDTKNNKLLLFENKVFKNAKGKNVLLELQEYIDTHQEGKIKDFIERYKSNKFIDSIIEYIYYQSGDNDWLANLLTIYRKQEITEEFVPYVEHRKINKKVLKLQNFLPHTSKNKVYRFGEKESLDSKRVGAKAAGQAKLHLSIKQLKKDTGIKNVASPNGIAIDYEILEKLLGEQYSFLYNKLETLINKEGKANSDYKEIQNIISQITDLIKKISDDKIIEYIGEENLEIFKDKLAIVRSSGVGEDSKEHSAAGIAESYGNVEYDDIAKAIKSSLASFFSPNAMDYMLKSKVLIKPTILIEEWINADKAGIMMSEDTEHNRLVQVINGQGDDIVSGRINPYSFVIDIKSGKKIDGAYTNKQTITDEILQDLVKIMEWFEQTEGYPVDIEFLIKDNIIYIVQVRPITTLYNKFETLSKRSPYDSADLDIIDMKTGKETETTKKPSALQKEGTKEKLYKRGFDKYLKQYLKKTGKSEKDLTEEEISAINEKAIKYHLSFFGMLYGVFRLEFFDIWFPGFIKNHNFDISIENGMKAAVFTILMLSVVIGVYSTICLFPAIPLLCTVAMKISALLNISTTVVINIFSFILGVASALVSSSILHSLWNICAIIFNTDFILQTKAFSEETKKTFTIGELVGVLKSIDLKEEINKSELSPYFVVQAKKNGAKFISIYDFIKEIRSLRKRDFRNNEGIEKYRRSLGPVPAFLRKNIEKIFEDECRIVENSFGFALGLSYTNITDKSKNKVNLVQALSGKCNIVSWEKGYKYFYGDDTMSPEDYMDKLREWSSSDKYNKKIFFFLPKHIDSNDLSFKTRKELEYIQRHPEMQKNVIFIFGLYDCFNIGNEEIFNKYFNEEKLAATIKRLFSNPNLYIKNSLGSSERIQSNGLYKFANKFLKLSFNSTSAVKKLELPTEKDDAQNTSAVEQLRKDIINNNHKKVCFICTEDINRSAVTHLLFEDRLLKFGIDNISVSSSRLMSVSQEDKTNIRPLEQDYKNILTDNDVDPDLIDDFHFETFSQKDSDSDYFIVANQEQKTLLVKRYNIDTAKIILYSELYPELKADSLQDFQNGKTSKERFVSLVKKIFGISLFNFILNGSSKWLASILLNTDTRNVVVSYMKLKSTEIEKISKKDQTKESESITEVYILEDIENLPNKYEPINTGIKVDGKCIYKIKIGNTLIYCAKDISRIQIAKVLNETEELKQEIKDILSLKGNIEIDGIIRRNGDGIGINGGLLEVGEMELFGTRLDQYKSPEEITKFMLSALGVKRTIGITFGQKTIIDLKQLSGQDLLTALENGRTRKVITEEQFRQLNLDENKILELRKKGMEIYVVTQSDIYKNTGISGKIIEEKDKFYIYDYYTDEKIEVDVLTAENGLGFLEQKIINSDKPIMIDIEILKENFQGKNVIEAFEILGTLLGKIKITMGLRNLNDKDIENIGYNIRFDKIPGITFDEAQKLLKSSNYMEIISLVGEDSEFGIILKSIRDKEDKKMFEKFIDIIKERILVKSKLLETGNEFEGIELKDKKLERLLGVLLIRAEQNNYKTLSQDETELLMKDVTGSNAMNVLMESMKQLETSNIKSGIKDSAEQEMLVNKIIQIILFSDRINGKQTQEQVGVSDISSYRAMLAAA